ncbi:MAG: hypothetical protein U0R50_07980 [Gaiellales bacterium]
MSTDSVLETLAPAGGWTGDWQDVLERVGPPRRRPGRRALIVIVAVLAVLVPLTAVAASDDWWFLGSDSSTEPAIAPIVVSRGSWNGASWRLIAFPSKTDALCWLMTTEPTGTRAEGAMACAPFEAVPPTSAPLTGNALKISYLSSGSGKRLPAYVVGPVVAAATTVEIRLAGGEVVHATTVPAPSPLERVRFYAAPLPSAVASAEVTRVTGLDANGGVVACLATATATDGASALSDCAPR